MKKESFFPIGILLTILAMGGVIYFVTRSETVAPLPTPPSETITIPPTPPGLFPRTAPAGQKEYQSATYHVSFFYPEALLVKEQKMPGTALLVTFEDQLEAQRNFQLFIMPYGEKTITPQRLKADIPSGVMKEARDFTIDGVGGVAFLSQDAKLGATREAWFIHHGFLYEFTTSQALDSFLQSILETWRFFPEEPKV